ncbi:type 1 fimbrial protein [Paraburkholderia panacisoli]|uniref:Type 1 fimbrial protein n=1 Tax=Paraburkholderia panacisoli TaxID=2603818 RepID=A0A5B0H9Z5_9BURK|nr:type 1 fimbrial protein [Paraburkholderia panacisoli]
MKFNRSGVIAAAVAMIAALPMASHAADGTITFNGSITAQTCNISGNGSGAADFSVTLPNVSVSALTPVGQPAGRTPFNIMLTGCTPNTGNVHTYFEAGPTTDATTGNLVLNAGGATNVEIGLLNGSDFSPIKVGFADASQNSQSVVISGGTATLPYYAQYVSTGVPTAGAANSSVMYTLAYE